MENYKNILTEQQKALTTDIECLINLVKASEQQLEDLKQRKSLAFKELRSIEKKLAGIKKPTQSGVSEKDVLGQ